MLKMNTCMILALLALSAAACGVVHPLATTGQVTVEGDALSPNVASVPVAVVAADPNAPSLVQGSVGGTQLTPRSVLFTTVVTYQQTYVTLLIADVDDLCDKLQANEAVKNMTSLGFTLNTADLGDCVAGGASTPGQHYAVGMIEQTDATCQDIKTFDQGWINSGKVSLQYIDATSAAGTFNVQAGSANETLTGQFHATYCPAVSGVGSDRAAGQACE